MKNESTSANEDEMTRKLKTTIPAVAILIALAVMAYQTGGTNQALLLGIGGLLGLSLYHASFGFTSGWRNFIRDRKSASLRAQMVMFAITVLLFFPILSSGTLFGDPVSGFIKPAGISVLVGAFLFGLGMQLGGGCASGTLFTVGGGSTKMVITLIFFIIGSLIGTIHMGWWRALPSLKPFSMISEFGLYPALGVNLGLFALIGFGVWFWEKKIYGTVEPIGQKSGGSTFLQGPWPMIWGAIALACLNFATLNIADRPWGVSGAFALWGAKIASVIGFDIVSIPFWQGKQIQLTQSVFADKTSVMNFGIMAGAFLAAGLSGKFAPVCRISAPHIMSAVIGGLLLGYGARLAYGCNIGAYFSGISSGSLHGWVWMIAGLTGNIVGIKFRPLFNLDMPIKTA